MPSEKMLLIVAYGVRNVSLQYLVDYNIVSGKILTRFSLNTEDSYGSTIRSAIRDRVIPAVVWPRRVEGGGP